MDIYPGKYFLKDDKELTFRTSEGEELYICNFIPYVTSAVKLTNSNALDEIEIEFSLFLNGDYTKSHYRFPLSVIKSFDWSNLDFRCQLNNELKTSTIRNHLYTIIQRQIMRDNFLQEIPIYKHTGWGLFNNTHVYLAGDKLITSFGIVPRNNYKCEDELMDLNLEIDDTLSTFDTAKYMIDMMHVAPGISDVLVANLLTGLLRALYIKAGVIPRFTCYLIGPPQFRKTAIACHTSSLYNRSTNEEFALINLLSSSSAVHRSISHLNDCCYIVDDLYKSERKQDMHLREDRLSEVIRTVGNNAAKATTEGKGVKNILPNCNVVCTAEYLLQGYSTLSRCVIIHVDKPISSKLLSKSQRNAKALSTFAYHFIRWCCENYDPILEIITNRWLKYQEERSTRTSSTERQSEAGFILYTSISIMTKYFTHNCIIEATSCKILRKEFKSHINELINRQMKDMQNSSSIQDENRFSKLVAKAYSNNSIDIERKKKKLSTKSQGFIYKDNLCLSPDYVLRMAVNYYKDKSITINKITAELKKNGLLEIDASNRSTKKINGIRLLHIPIDKLNNFVEDHEYERVGSALSNITLLDMEKANAI